MQDAEGKKDVDISENSSVGEVLVVDDQTGLLKVYDMMFTRAGFTVRTAEGAGEALEVFRVHHNSLDIVVLDYHLEDTVTGVDVYRQMLELRPDLRGVLCSGEPKLKLLDKFKPEWRLKLLSKPFKTEQLIGIVKDLISRND